LVSTGNTKTPTSPASLGVIAHQHEAKSMFRCAVIAWTISTGTMDYSTTGISDNAIVEFNGDGGAAYAVRDAPCIPSA